MKSTARKQTPKPRSQPSTRWPRILIAAGSAKRAQAVRRSLRRIRARLVEAEWPEAVERVDQGFTAMVIAEPLPVSLAGAVAAIRGRREGRHLAVYALADGDSSSHKARHAYLAGANAVIDWPRERALFAGVLAETLGMAVVRGPSSRPDLALCRTVRAHLRLGPCPGGGIRLSSERGVVTAAGEARSLAELREIVETIAAVPGVRRVLTTRLRVAPSGIPDATVRKNVKAVIRSTSGIEARALSVSVRGGRVVVRGAVASRARLHDLLDTIAAVPGVRDLDWKIDLPPTADRSDREATRRLRLAIAILYPEERIHVAVFAGVAVLSGRVRSLAVSRAVARLASRDDGVARVVDKLAVEPRRA